MNIKKARNKKLMEKARILYEDINNYGPYSSCDVLVYQAITLELETRGFKEFKTITFVKGV